MSEPRIHIDTIPKSQNRAAMLMYSAAGMLDDMGLEIEAYKQRIRELETEIENMRARMLPTEQKSCIADGKQNEVIAVLNAMYAAGMAVGSKKEFMRQMATALGCEKIADYSAQLYKIKLTYKYDEIFKRLSEVAQQEKTQDNP